MGFVDKQQDSVSIEDLEDEQQQIFEQVEQQKEEASDGIGNAKNELEGSVFGVIDDHDETGSSHQAEPSVSDEELNTAQTHNTEQTFESQETTSETSHESLSEEVEVVAEEESESEAERETAESALQLRQPVEAVDPFNETFAEEENLIDRFAPFVAHQNQSSLTITSKDLSMLCPNDEQGCSENNSESESVEFSGHQVSSGSKSTNESDSEKNSDSEMTQTTNAEPEETDHVEVELNETLEAIPNAFEAETVQTSSEYQSESSDRTIENGDLESQSDSNENAQPSQGNLHEHVSEVESPDIQHQAAEILKRLNPSKSVSHETEDSSPSADESQQVDTPTETVASQNETAESSGYHSEFDRQSAALDESQQILNEILEQKHALSQQREDIAKSNSSSIKIDQANEHGQHSPHVSSDDSEMIIVNRMEQPAQADMPKEPAVPFPSTPVSTGRAERMDYQKLFDQLRDISNAQEE